MRITENPPGASGGLPAPATRFPLGIGVTTAIIPTRLQQQMPMLSRAPLLLSHLAALVEHAFCLLFAACDIRTLSTQEQQYTKEEGLAEGTKTTACNLKALGGDIETIVKATGLSREEVEAL